MVELNTALFSFPLLAQDSLLSSPPPLYRQHLSSLDSLSMRVQLHHDANVLQRILLTDCSAGL